MDPRNSISSSSSTFYFQQFTYILRTHPIFIYQVPMILFFMQVTPVQLDLGFFPLHLTVFGSGLP